MMIIITIKNIDMQVHATSGSKSAKEFLGQGEIEIAGIFQFFRRVEAPERAF